MTITLPELSLVLLIGVSGSGKSTFARRCFKPTEILSSDFCRGLVADDENDQSASREAFEVLHFILRKRLAAGRLTVVDATNVQAEARKPLIAIAREYHCLPVAIVLDVPEGVALERNRGRPDRDFGPHVVRQQAQQLRRSLRGLEREGFRHRHVLRSPEEIASVGIERQPLWNNRRDDHGPFDLIGDVHGCFDELVSLLRKLGHAVDESSCAVTPAGRRLIFLGDLVDRGPKTPQVLRLVMNAVRDGVALCVPGNHDIKLMRALRGRDVQVTHGLAESLAQLSAESAEFRGEVATFLDGLVSHYLLDEGRLVVAHAGMKESMQGRGSGAVRDFALYGETTGETDEFGLPVRHPWAAEYRGRAMVVYGHTPVPQPEWLNGTINIDTGCVFGGSLTALRYPEKELVSTLAIRTYATPSRPFLDRPAAESAGAAGVPAQARTAQQAEDDLLDLSDVAGKRLVQTRLQGGVTVREENSSAALEVMSRFAVDPRWLIYLPPTMAPCGTSRVEGLLEHPAEAFGYFRQEGVPSVICEEKHMGSRTVVLVCRDDSAAARRFGVLEGGGICITRTGRRFFDDPALETCVLERVREGMSRSGLWEELATDWVCLDCELMPWSAKAQALVREQYAPVAVAAAMALSEASRILAQARDRGVAVEELAATTADRLDLASRYSQAYRRYCWPVRSMEDLRLAPFHLLASEGAVHVQRDHAWHLTMLSRLAGELIIATPSLTVDLTDPRSEAAAVDWWEQLTARGGEGMVVKPLSFVARGRKGLVQPAVKCRGREYLRIIYGPEYTLQEHLERLRSRGLQRKRSLALREFALGIEGLERFVRREPLRRVHECVFAVLALESEPVDPRL